MSEYDLARAFERIENSLIDSMMRNFKHHRAEETAHGYNWEQWQVKQLEALEEYRRKNKERFSAEFEELNTRLEKMLRQTAADSAYKQEQKILKAIQKGFEPIRPSGEMQAAFFTMNERKMNALVNATTHDLSRAEHAVLRMSNDKYRKAIFDAQVYMNSGAATYEKAVDMAVHDMLAAGLNCVEYKNGARHTLTDYAEMAIRTANKRAYLRGEGQKMQEWGISTVIINRRHGACGRCADFVGMVFIDDIYAGGKKTDAGGKYPLLSDAVKAGLFHPRCKDSSSMYLEGISTPPDREVLPKKAQEDLTEIERAEQKAAYGKRMEKMNKRLSKYALDPDNKKLYGGRKDQWSAYAEKWQSYHEKQLEKAEKSGIIKISRNIASRNLPNGLRQPRDHILSDDEILSLKEDIKSIEADEKVFQFNEGIRTGYDDVLDVIRVRGDVLPDKSSDHPRDKMSSRAALAHEYYGHRAFRGTKLRKGSWNDEFRASYFAAKVCPNLSLIERQHLILDALERAKEQGITIKHNAFIRRVVYGY